MRYLFLLIGFVLISACSSTKELDSVDAGRTQVAEPGLPNFDMEVVPTFRENVSGFDLYVGLPYNSLIYLRKGSQFVAEFETQLQVFAEGNNVAKIDETATDSLKATYRQTQLADANTFKKRYTLANGTYIVKVSITDLGTRKTAFRRQRITIQNLATDAIALSRVLIEGKFLNKGFAPVVAFHTPANVDSLRAVTEIYNTGNIKEVKVGMLLLKVASDQQPANPVFMFSPMYGNIAYRGVDFGSADTLQKSLKRIENPLPETVVEFNLPKLTPGVYQVLLKAEADGVTTQQSKRLLYIKEPGFPKVETLSQMIEPLVYITYADELRPLLMAKSAEEQKLAFDTFWGAQMPNRQAAENALRVFYSRVEEANLYFSTQKEGWKTDKGMVYILLGAPMTVENQGESEVWRYASSSRDPFSSFAFQKIYPSGDDGFTNYVLIRQSAYEVGWRRRVEALRQGSIF
jgi:GWxTD domain-containing protein